jgi:hypothetical protein
MEIKKTINTSLKNGNASRYIKPRWLRSGKLSTEAFDLRDGPPPETYVSHFLVDGKNNEEIMRSAYLHISSRISLCETGSIAILNIAEALSEVNDEIENIIDFLEKNLPHCGLIYKTANQPQIQEAKATLCFLASKKLASAQLISQKIAKPDIAKHLPRME